MSSSEAGGSSPSAPDSRGNGDLDRHRRRRERREAASRLGRPSPHPLPLCHRLAPLAVFMFNFPFVVGAGNEKYAPAAFFFATIILTIFSVAYVQMARKLRAAGGMFTYVSHGLGRTLGMVSGLSLAAAYTLFGASLIGGFAAFAQAKVTSAFDMDSPINWIWFAILGIVGISALGYFDIPISAKILGVFLITELFIIFAFTIGVFIQGGNDGVSIAPVLPWNAFKGIAFGLGIFIAFWSWVGFEAAPNYAEESKNPHRTIPIAVYVSCVFVGVLYTLASWASVSSYGPGNQAFDALTAGRRPSSAASSRSTT